MINSSHIFFQLKDIFHTLESLGSARIEGNNTTLSEYIENKLENPNSNKDHFLEIRNSEKAIAFIENNIEENKIDADFISNIHKIVISGLDINKEGSKTPGIYRKCNVIITKSNHTTPEFILVHELMNELIEFINKDYEEKYDLLKTAICHHYFA